MINGSTSRTLVSLATVIAVLTTLFASLTAPPADAVVPGTNGPIAYSRGQDLWIVNADGTNPTPRSVGFSDSEPAVSPDGTKIVFNSFRDGNNEIYIMNADGTGQTRLTTSADVDFSPAWSPDGTKIAFRSDRDGIPEVYVMNANGTSQTRLTTATGAWINFDPAWSPDGTKIAFTTTRDGNNNAEVYVMDASGANQVNLSNSPGADSDPAWSPDGTRIAFSSRRAANTIPDLFTMAPDGSDQRNITSTPDIHEGQPDWSIATCTGHPFTDVPTWADLSVDWAHCGGLMSGFGSKFRPLDSISRAQVARLLYRIAGNPDVAALPEPPQTDVPFWAKDAITWLLGNGHAAGFGNNTFRPNDPITRAQLTRMLYRIAGSPTTAPANSFVDVDDWADLAVNWITDPVNDPPFATGYGNRYRPNVPITRAATTRMVCRIVGSAPC